MKKRRVLHQACAFSVAVMLVGVNAVPVVAADNNSVSTYAATDDSVARTITVNFNAYGNGTLADGSNNIPEQVVTPGEGQITVPDVKPADGYYFVGWELNRTNAIVSPSEITSNTIASLAADWDYIAFTAKFAPKTEETKKTAHITFTINAGDEEKGKFASETDKKVFDVDENDGTQYTIPKVVANDGYKFAGWVSNVNPDLKWDAGSSTFGVSGLAYYYGEDTDGYVTLSAVFEKDDSATEEKKDAVLYVHYVDVNSDNWIENNIQTIKKNGKVGDKAKFNEEDLVLPVGYELAEENWSASVEYGKDDDANVNVKKVSEERNVIVTIQAGEGTFVKEKADDSEKTRVYKTTEFSGNSIQLPTVEAPEGYEFVGWTVNSNGLTSLPADAKTLGTCGLGYFPEGSDEGYISLEALYVKKDEVKRDVTVNIAIDPNKGEFVGEGIEDGHATITRTDLDEFAEEPIALPEVKAYDGYEFDGWIVAGKENLRLDADAKTLGIAGVANFYGDETTGYISVEPVFKEKETPEEKRTVTVNIAIDPNKGEFVGEGIEDGHATITRTDLDEFAEEPIALPEVKAYDGYEFDGWVVEGSNSLRLGADAYELGTAGLGYFYGDENVGYISVEPVFKEVQAEKRTVTVNIAIDPNKGEFVGEGIEDGHATITRTDLDEFAEEPIALPEVKAYDGYKLAGWVVEGSNSLRLDADAYELGTAGLGYFYGDENVGYISVEPIFEAEETPVEKRTVTVNIAIDPNKGEFVGEGIEDGHATITRTDLDEFAEEPIALPEVKAYDGYKLAGWVVEGSNSLRLDADAYELGTAGLGYFYGDETVGYIAVEPIFEETTVDPVNPVEPTDPANPDTPSKDDTKTDDTKTDDKKSDVTKKTEDTKKTTNTKKKSAKKADEKKSDTVQTGDHSNVFVYVATLLIAGAAAVVAFFRRRNA